MCVSFFRGTKKCLIFTGNIYILTGTHCLRSTHNSFRCYGVNEGEMSSAGRYRFTTGSVALGAITGRWYCIQTSMYFFNFHYHPLSYQTLDRRERIFSRELFYIFHCVWQKLSHVQSKYLEEARQYLFSRTKILYWLIKNKKVTIVDEFMHCTDYNLIYYFNKLVIYFI